MSKTPTLLIIDDEEAICFAFKRYFESRGMGVTVSPTCRQGLEACRAVQPDVVFLDVRLPDGNGLDILEELQAIAPKSSIIVITAYGTLETVTRAIQGKAFEYMVKPLDLDKAAELVEQAQATKKLLSGAAAAGDEGSDEANPILVGKAPVMQEVYKRIGLVAHTDTTVLILGETGTGKELVASAIHQHSPRHDKPFVAVNCAALPESLVEGELFGYVKGAFTGAAGDKAGRFEAANGGTLFLDEIGDLPLAVQVKLLRFLDSQVIERLGSVTPIPLNVRVLAATNADLEKAIAEGRFRADLYYRLAVLQIRLPALRDRLEDVPALANHFLGQLCSGPTPPISEEAIARMTAYPWPGNVRELRNALEHAAVVSGGSPVLATHLPETVRKGAAGVPADTSMSSDELLRTYIASLDDGSGNLHARAVEPLEDLLLDHALAKTGGNRSAAADYLGLHRNTVRNRLREREEGPGGVGEASTIDEG